MKNHVRLFTIVLFIFIFILSLIVGIVLLTHNESAFTYDELSRDLQKIEYVKFQEDIKDFVTIRTLDTDEANYVLNELCKVKTSPYLGINPPFPLEGEKAIILYYPDYMLTIREYEIEKIYFDSSKNQKVEIKYIRYNEDISNILLTIENN